MELTLSEVKPIIKYIIENNRRLEENGQRPYSIGIEGIAGVGKSLLIEEIARELNYNYIFLSCAQLAEPSDLVGFPIREHYVCKKDESRCEWITSELISAYIEAGWEITPETRMGYAIPAWLKTIDKTKPLIFLADDVTRSTPAILNALLEIIYKQEYISWKLPPNSTVILTSNPDNGEYNLSSTDEAFKTRYINFSVKWDKYAWASWAEENKIDNRCINFMLNNSDELMDRTIAKESKINARSFTMFSRIIEGIHDWSTPENLAFIMQIASGCFLDDDDIVGSLFARFVANKLDKLLSPEEIVMSDWSKIRSILEDQLYDGDNFRADIASIITTRFCNYSLLYLGQEGSKINIIIDRIVDFIDNKKILLTEDLLFNMCKNLCKAYPGKCNKLLLNQRIAKMLI